MKNIELPTMLGITEVGKMLGWTRQKVHTYWKRGKIPEPTSYIGNRPVWTLEQICEWINKKAD